MNCSKKTFATIGMIILVIVPFVQISHQSIFANHGQEIDLKFSDAQFLILPDKNIHQVKFTAIYSVLDPETVVSKLMG